MPFVTTLVAMAAVGQTATQADPLAITLPSGTSATFEVDARDDDLLATVKQFVDAMGKNFIGVVPNNTGMSSILNSQTLGAILRNVRRLHVVSFKGAPADVVSFFEPSFSRGGAHRMLYVNQQDPVLVMRTEAPVGLAAVVKVNDSAYVVRTEGLPDMALIGKLFGSFASSRFGGAAPTPAIAAPTPTKASPAKPAVKKK